MSYPSSFGPTSFDISINGHELNLCIKLAATTSPANGTYTMAVGALVNNSCSASSFTNVATVTLDEDGEMTECKWDNNKFGGRNWQSMSGVFNTDGTGSGEINDDAEPTGINGVWAAGGSGGPPRNPEGKQGQHA